MCLLTPPYNVEEENRDNLLPITKTVPIKRRQRDSLTWGKCAQRVEVFTSEGNWHRIKRKKIDSVDMEHSPSRV